jgi:hypothetical protein
MTRQAILVRALEALADELAQARAEARQHCAAAERARNAAQRLGQARQPVVSEQPRPDGTLGPTSENLQREPVRRHLSRTHP